MKLAAASSLENTAGKVPPRLVPDSARSRITTTTWRRPLRFSARRRSLRSAFRFDVATDVTAVDLDIPPDAAEPQAFNLGRHRFADLVGQHERGFVLNIEVARQRERRLALDLVAEDHDRRQVVADLQLVEGEQGAGRRAEVAPAGRAAEPRRSIGPRAGPARRATAVRADRRPLGLRPADRTEHRPGLRLFHPQDLLQADGPRRGGQEKVLRHGQSPGSAIPRVYSDRAAAKALCSLYVLICQRLIRKPRPWGMILRIPSCSGGG